MVNPSQNDVNYWGRVMGGVNASSFQSYEADAWKNWSDEKLEDYAKRTGFVILQVDDTTSTSLKTWLQEVEPLLWGSDTKDVTRVVYSALEAFPPRKGDDYDINSTYKMYIRLLSPLPLWALDRAVSKILMTSKWRPSIAEINEEAQKAMGKINITFNVVKKAVEKLEAQHGQ